MSLLGARKFRLAAKTVPAILVHLSPTVAQVRVTHGGAKTEIDGNANSFYQSILHFTYVNSNSNFKFAFENSKFVDISKPHSQSTVQVTAIVRLMQMHFTRAYYILPM
jgi:hypothetical protein